MIQREGEFQIPAARDAGCAAARGGAGQWRGKRMRRGSARRERWERAWEGTETGRV